METIAVRKARRYFELIEEAEREQRKERPRVAEHLYDMAAEIERWFYERDLVIEDYRVDCE